MARTATIHLRVEPELKTNADSLFKELGITTTDAVNMFLTQAVIHGGLPFSVKKAPNSETLAAMKEANEISKKGNSRFNSIDEMFEELDNDA